VLERLVLARLHPPLTQFQVFRPVPVGIQEATFDQDCTAGSLGQCICGNRRQESRRSSALTCPPSWHDQPRYTVPMAADWVCSDRNGAVVAPVLL